jgi:hypothetical protein
MGTSARYEGYTVYQKVYEEATPCQSLFASGTEFDGEFHIQHSLRNGQNWWQKRDGSAFI